MEDQQELVRQMKDIKALLILLLSSQNVNSEEIGKVLGVGGSQVRNVLSGANRRRG